MRYDSPFPENLLLKGQRCLDMTSPSSNVFVCLYLLLLKTPKITVDVLVMLLMDNIFLKFLPALSQDFLP